jgi:curved DNA-binding protein CbpA
MNDAFSALGFVRRPWLDADEVRANFQRLAAIAHPDRTGSAADFAELTRAYGILREPTPRLRHFLELERVQPATGIPADLIEWFPRVANVLKQSPAEQQTVEATLTELNGLRDAALARVREIDRDLGTSDFDELSILLSRLVFLDKWTTQLGEALLALKM